MNQGTLKWFNPDEGYGYIMPDDGNEEVFFQLLRNMGWRIQEPQEGERVTHKLVEG
jgi:cold shock protein